MSRPKRVPLDALPVEAVASLKGFIFAYHLPEQNRFVIRDADPTQNVSRELEFDASRRRFLAPTERLELVPGPNHVALMDDKVRVLATHYLKPGKEELWVHFDIQDAVTGNRIAELDRAVYSSLQWDVVSEVSRAVEDADFPRKYATWTEDEKVSYMGALVHQWRRGAGSCGANEDDALTPELLSTMERIDPDVRLRLSPIADLAARMGQIEPEELKQSFRDRLGIVIP